MEIIPPKEQVEMEKAIKFLVKHIDDHCRNPKPLIIHSLRVGLKAEELGLSQKAILAAFLHDLLEDTNCTLDEIKKEFGKEVAKLVFALTQYKIKNYKLRWHKLLAKIKKAGKEAMLIKVIDANANSPYLLLVKDKKILKETFWKMNFTLKTLKPCIGKTPAFFAFERNAKKMIKKFNGKKT
ncbi:MAG: HD domain-containing protein [Candidatus Pacebacteria bacterium]|nr:HD domain-containing protein [Candidatus Paceibacterota bacterium]